MRSSRKRSARRRRRRLLVVDCVLSLRLAAMLAFRDDVMMGDPQMRELVELYYEKAPEVVAFFMYNVSDARAFWKSVKSFWIDPIYSSLMYGDYETAVNKYLGMFVALENVMNSWQYESARNS